MIDVPDIVDPEYYVRPINFNGWEPVVSEIDLEDPNRLFKGGVLASELALQMVFGNNGHTLISKHSDESTSDQVFEQGRRFALESHTIGGVHDAGYLFSLALWHDRNTVMDIGLGYDDYSSIFDGHMRQLTFVDINELKIEMINRLPEYISFVEVGCLSLEDVDNMNCRAMNLHMLNQGRDGFLKILRTDPDYRTASKSEMDFAAEVLLQECRERIAKDDARMARAGIV